MKLKLKKQKGITLTSLIITVIVIGIIGGTATYTGISVYNDAKEEAIVQELKIIQVAVENEYGKIILDDYDYTFYGTDVRDDRQGVTEALKDNYTIKGYKELTPENLKNNLNLNGMTRTVYVNFLTRDVRDKNGFSYNGKKVYSLKEAGLINQEPGATEVEHVKNGLKLYLDGIDNGYDELGKWKDLSGNKNNTKVNITNEKVYFDDNENGLALKYNSANFTLTNNISLIDGQTLNLVYKINGYTSNNSYKPMFNAASSIGFRSLRMQVDNALDGTMLFYTHGKSTQKDGEGGDVVGLRYGDGSKCQSKENKTYSMNWTMYEDEVNYHKNVFLDGKEIYWADKNREQKVKNGKIPEASAYGTENYIKHRTLSNWSMTDAIDAVVYAIRVYDRVLTDKEIAHNYYVDAVRYGLY